MITETALHALNAELKDIQPYPGLRPFVRAESRYFKGRDAQVEEIIQRLASDSCVVVLGGSGCGKSSIVRAGVVPALRLKMIPGRGDFWRVAICSPGRAPVANLVDALDGVLTPDDSGGRRKQIRDVLYGSNGLGGFLPTFKKDIPLDPGLSETILDKANLLVLIDQFEELFREENRGKAETAALAGFIIDAWRRRDCYPGLYLVLTMRTDDLHRCAEFLDLPDVINASGYLTRRLKETELRQAIVAPLRPAMFRAGLLKGERPSGVVDLRPFDVQVVTELLDAVEEIAHDPDHLPLLQHLLAVLWRTTLDRWQREAAACPEAAVEPQEPQVTLQDLARALGFRGWGEVVRERSAAYRDGVSGWLLRHCLEHIAEQLYTGSIYNNRLTERQQNIARVAFCLMGEMDDRGNFKRRWTNREEIARVAGLKAPDADVEAVIHRFYIEHRLLWVRPSGEIDVSHESLMRNWPRLGEQLKTDRDAGAAYQYLVQRHEEWQQTRRLFWLSWLTKWFGLLPAHEVEWVRPLLAPCYNASWSERFVSDDEQRRDTEGRDAQRSQEVLGNESVFLACREYVRRSVRRNTVARGMKVLSIPIVVFFIIFFVQSEKLKAQSEVIASAMWSGLGGYSIVLPDEKVRLLWQLATTSTAVRSVFVNQLETLPHQITRVGDQLPPAVRAVGLRWTEDMRHVGLQAVLERAAASREDWGLAALACVVEALGNRIDNASKDRAFKLLGDYLRPQPSDSPPLDSRQLMSYARVFACVGDQVPVETRNAALRRMLQAVTRSAEPITDGFGILSVANATAVLASQPADTVDHTLVQAITRRSVDTVIEQLGKQPGFIAIRMARSLVPLIAMLPNSEQKEALGQLLSFVATKTEPDEDLLLVLAQAVEVLAEKSVFSKGNQLEQWLNEQEVWLALAKPDGVAHLAVARLIVPLAEAVEMPTDVVEKLLQIAGIEGSATDLIAITNAIRQAPLKDEGSPTSIANRMRLGLQGRLLATLVTQGHVDPSASGSAAEVIREAFKPVSMQPTGSFAREGLARALAALAPQLGDRVRESALETARMYLARTGSAGEAAAWSRTIAKLLESEKDDLKFVEQIVEVLKYPNTALRPREPGVEEPRSATDILVKALRSRLALHLPDGKRPWGGDLQQVLDEIKKDERFRRISLTEPPECPKLSGVCLEPNS